MDVVSAFVGVDGFEVTGVAHDVVFIGDAIAAVHVSGDAGYIQSFAAIVSF